MLAYLYLTDSEFKPDDTLVVVMGLCLIGLFIAGGVIHVVEWVKKSKQK